MTGRENNRKILESYGGKSYFDYAKFVGDYLLYFRYYKDDWAEITGYFNNIIYTSLALSLAIAFAAVYFLSGTITSPLVS